jgi:YVTN family beta-propeller protein
MGHLKKISFAAVLLILILVLSATSAIHAAGVVSTVTVGTFPDGVAYDSGMGEIFVANFASNTVSVISDSTNKVVATVTLGNGPDCVAYDSGKGEIFVTNYGSGTVSVISDSNNSIVATIAVGTTPTGVAYDSGKSEIFVANSGDGVGTTVSVISDDNNTVVATVNVGTEPEGVAYDSGKDEIFVANTNSASVSVISDNINVVVASVPVGPNPFGAAYDSGTGQIFIANYFSSSVSVISDNSNAIEDTLTVGSYPEFVVYDSGMGEIFVTNTESDTVSIISGPFPSPTPVASSVSTQTTPLAATPIPNPYPNPATISAQGKTIIVPDQYPTIQDAINNASAGDTIFVRSGTYNQTLTINQSVNLIGENAGNTYLTIPVIYSYAVDVPPPTTYVIDINANNVYISGFTITNLNIAGCGIGSNGNGNQITNITFNSPNGSGIEVSGSDQLISNNVIDNLVTGVQCSGSYNQIIDNNLVGDTTCIFLSGSCNSIKDNSVSTNEGTGIILNYANTNVICNNVISGSFFLTSADSNLIYNNSMDGHGYLELGDYPNGQASNNFIAGNTLGANLTYAWAVLIGYGSENVLYGNLIDNNGGIGLALGGTDIEVDNNLIYYNMFVNNSKNFGANWQVIGTNSFDNGSVGNYWGDYQTKYPSANEVNDSGIWNTPYLVYNNVSDNYPLMAPFDISTISVQLPSWTSSLPVLLALPSFPTQNLSVTPTSSSSPTPTFPSTSGVAATSASPQFPSMLIILTVIIAVCLSIAAIVTAKKLKANKSK